MSFSAFQHPALLSTIGMRFLPWYFLEVPARIAASYIEYFLAFNEVFSFFFLIRTLLSPWKSITENYPTRGLNIGQIAQAFTLNVTSRVIGFIFRMTAFLLGVSVQIALVALFVLIFVMWLTFPILLGIDILFLIGLL